MAKIMKHKISLFIILFIFFPLLNSPTLTFAEEIMSEVLIVVKGDAILAFSSLKNNWVSVSLNQNEKVIKKHSKGNVAIAITNKRILGFSVFTNEWKEERLGLNELLKELQVDGNVATVVTDSHVFAFNAHTGKWLEAK